MPQIRLATTSDIEQIIDLDKADDYYDFYTLPKILERAIEREQLLVYELKGRIVGYTRWGFIWDLELPLIEMIRVLPEFRGKGIASDLIKFLSNKLKSEEYESLLSSLNSGNIRSKSLHEKLGFEEIGKMNLIPEEKVEIFFRLELK